MDDFARDAELYRKELLAHCYRMTGSLTEAEDLVQETMLRAWQQRDAFEGRASLRTWLHRIATNASIDALRSRKRRTLPTAQGAPGDGKKPMPAPDVEQGWLEPYPDELLPDTAPGPDVRVGQRESVATAFMVALHELSATQRAALLLRDVLGFSAEDAATALASSATAVNSALLRAREAIAGAQVPVRAPDDESMRALLGRYLRAWQSRDVNLLATLLRQDVVLSMPPIPAWYRGIDDVTAVLGGQVWLPGLEIFVRPLAVNGGPGFCGWTRAPGGAWEPLGIQAVTVVDGAVAAITCYVGGALFPRFGLPPVPPA